MSNTCERVGRGAHDLPDYGNRVPSVFVRASIHRLACNAPPAATSVSCQRGEVLHVRTEYDRAIGDDRFHWILSAARGQAFAHEDDRRNRIPVPQFARRIDEQTVGGDDSATLQLRRTDRIPRARSWSAIIRVRSTWRGAMMRKSAGNSRRNCWKIFARISSSPGCVLPPSRIGRPGSIPSRSKTARGISGRGATFSGSNLMLPTGKIRAGSAPNDSQRATSSCSCTQIKIELLEIWPNEQIEGPETPFRTRREARIDESDRNFLPMRDCSQVRPDLGFYKDDTDWPDECEGAAHDRPEVERGVEHLDPVRRLSAG